VSAHVFVDETKQRSYLLVASVVVPGDLDPIRRTLRGLVLPGQRRLHMKDENDQRRRAIAAAIAASGGAATIYDAGRRYRNERERRAACLRALVGDAARRGHAMLGQQHPQDEHSHRRLLGMSGVDSPLAGAPGTFHIALGLAQPMGVGQEQGAAPRCGQCGAQLPARAGRGRARLFCDATCRSRARSRVVGRSGGCSWH
jgi:hypothetical protein